MEIRAAFKKPFSRHLREEARILPGAPGILYASD
jgi:hypothetical protein